jgi:hypothetical protein
MRQGVPPPSIARAAANATAGGKLILLHGYCAERNPFAVYPEDWSDALFYLRGAKVTAPHLCQALSLLVSGIAPMPFFFYNFPASRLSLACLFFACPYSD